MFLLPLYLLPRPWRVSEPMRCPTLEVQGLLSDLAEPAITTAMDSSLDFRIHRFPHAVHPGDSFKLTPLRFNDWAVLSDQRVHHLLFPREGIIPWLADSPLLEVCSCRTGQHTGQSTWHYWTCPVHPVDKLILFLPPTHSLLVKFRNCLIISTPSCSSHINSLLLKSYRHCSGWIMSLPNLYSSHCCRWSCWDTASLQMTKWENLELLWFRSWSSTPKVCVVLTGGWFLTRKCGT